MLRHTGFVVVVSAASLGLVHASLAQPSTGETGMAAKMRCEQFKQNPDGSWTGASGAQVDGKDVAGKSFTKDDHIAIALDQKCTPKK